MFSNSNRSRILILSLTGVFLFSGLACKKRTMNENTAIKSEINKFQNRIANQEFLKKCGSEMTQEQYIELLNLTDNSTFKDYKEAAPRAERIAEIFGAAKDRRGIFASMYVAITNESVGSTSRGEYKDNVRAAKLVKRFAERYFEPLHGYLWNGSNENQIKNGDSKKEKVEINWEWKDYYELAEKCNSSDLNILGTGVNNHMTMDLPYALAEIEAPKEFEDDFLKFGEILIQKKRESTNLLVKQQNVYAAEFFDLFVMGKVLDNFLPKGTAATLGFRLIRGEAWQNGQSLQIGVNRPFAAVGIRAAWTVRQGVLSLMPKSNSNMKGTEEK